MIKYLEELLLLKTKGQQSEILYAQWNFDKVLVPTALQSVSNLFPHYSLHDETHSATIVSNIVRVLGKRSIESLSAIDIWLILEAAYWHDLGMVIPGDQLLSTLKSDDFVNFFEELMAGTGPLSTYARAFKVENGKIEWHHSAFTYEHVDGMRFILAEYFRGKHGNISEIYINNPGNELSLLSPRAVIPARLWKILGKICSSHTKDFNDVMLLPFSEVGLDDEDAHPRFVACMLRIGDLLDLDNNRFSDVMLRTLSAIPVDTFIHKAKHMSIESFRVDTEVIEITAKCLTYDTADAAHHWFNYLSGEINSQLINWKKIAPGNSVSSLPVIERLAVELEGFNYIESQHKPQFTVDTEKMLTLLKGLGLYEHEFEALREIIQNAVDATLVRMWEEYSDIFAFDLPEDDKFLKTASLFAIKVNIDKVEKLENQQRWSISIEDNGTGISTEDLKYLMKTGSSSKNKFKSDKIRKMPQWLKPSGAFGVGFQSIFMLTEKVVLETKSLYTGESKRIELYRPNSQMNGAILITNLPQDFKQKPGTRLSFDYFSSAVPERYKVHYNGGMAREIVDKYDYFTSESFDVEIANIVDAIEHFSSKCYVPIKLFLNKEYLDFALSDSMKFRLYDNISHMQFNIEPIQPFHQPLFRTFYKGQPFETNRSFDFLNIELNVHSPSAMDVLTINRAKINSKYDRKLIADALAALFRLITSKFDDLFVDVEEKISASLFLHNYYGHKQEEREKINGFSQWRMFKFSDIVTRNKSDCGNIDSLTFGEAIEKAHFFEATTVNNPQSNQDMFYFSYDEESRTFKVKIEGHPRSAPFSFFYKKITKELKYITQIVVDQHQAVIKYSLKPGPFPLTLSDIVRILDDSKSRFTTRIMFPCIDDYIQLRLNDEAWVPYAGKFGFDHQLREPVEFPFMASPYEYLENAPENFKVSINSKLVDWVFENRYAASTTRNDIEGAYKSFCDAVSKYRENVALADSKQTKDQMDADRSFEPN